MMDGSTMTVGGNLRGAHMVSLVPAKQGLPQHDIIGLDFERRFGRGFIKGMGGGYKEYLHCIVCKNCRVYIKSSDGSVLVTPYDFELYL